MDFSNDNTRSQQMESSDFIFLKKKKKRRMRILSTVFFLSFLAGKFDAFEQITYRTNNEKIGTCALLS